MTAREFMDACNTFTQFGKIKDIDFETELWCDPIDRVNKLYIRGFDFEDGTVVLGELIDFGCDCCGYYYEDKTYDLYELYVYNYLGDIIDMLGKMLTYKTGV
jgi:hypothetical protein